MSSITGPQSGVLAPNLPYGPPVIGGPAAPGAGEGLQIGDLIGILKRRSLLIIITAALLFAVAVAATLLTRRYFPAYPSEAMFELDPPRRGMLLDDPGGEVNFSTDAMEQALMTEARKLKSMGLLFEVVGNPAFQQTSYYGWYNNNAEEAAYGLRDDLQVNPLPDSRLIRAALASRSREESRTILNLVVERYRTQFEDAEQRSARQDLQNINETLDRLTNDLANARRQAAAFREQTDVPSLEANRAESAQIITGLRADLHLTETDMSSIESKIQAMAGLDPAQLPLTAEQRLVIESDPLLRFYVSQVQSFDTDLEVVKLRLGDNHPDVRQLQLRRDRASANEVNRREELIDRVRTRQLENLREARTETRNRLEQRQSQIAVHEAEARDLDRSLLKFDEMKRDIEALENQIAEMKERRTAAEYRAEDKRARLNVVQPPTLAVEPSRPNLPVWIAIGAILSLLGGVGLAFLREFSDTAVRTPIDVIRHGHLSVLGTVPRLDDEEADVETIEDAVRRAPHSLVAEAFRRVSTNLQFSGPPEWQRSLLITSPKPGDGKTAIAINMARTLANAGHRVLLIDCNFRRPGIRSAFNGSKAEGLSNILIGESTLTALATKTDTPNLDVLSSGPMPPTPTELLGSANMRKLLDESLQKYDRVIMDGPPALLVSDAGVIATLVDGVIIVTLADSNSKGVLKRTREVFEKINARVVGAILNGVRARSGGYFRQQYREFYEYTSEEPAGELPGPDGDGKPKSDDDKA